MGKEGIETMGKRFFARHAKSSAALVSLGIHTVIIVIAISFVAVTVIQKEDQNFEAKKVNRPKMQLKKLQVPVNIKKKVQKPRLRKRIVVQPKLNQQVPDIKLPEITGIKGGMGNAAGSGLGGGGSLGFSMPEMNLFGIRSRGEKIVFLLDTDNAMMLDTVGGIPAYTIIKDELAGLIAQLPSTALFNVIVFEHFKAVTFSKELTPANKDNVEKLKAWLAPLNADMQQYGVTTLSSSGYPVEFEPMGPIYNDQGGWPAGLTYAVKKKADVVYWLGANDGGLIGMQKHLWDDCERGKPLLYPNGRDPNFRDERDYEGYGVERWNNLVAKARRMHEEENARRLKKGEPVKVLSNESDIAVVLEYFPDAPIPEPFEQPEFRHYTVDDTVRYIHALDRKYKDESLRVKSGLKAPKMSLNAIHFVQAGEETKPLQVLTGTTKKMNGKYRQIRGLEAIKSSTSSN